VKAPGKGGPLFGIISNRSTSACSGLTPAELFPRVFDQNLPDQPAEDTRLPASRRRGEGDRRLRPAYCPSRCSPDALVLGALPVVERVFDLIRLDVNGSRTPPIKRRWVQRGAGTFLHGGTLARKTQTGPVAWLLQVQKHTCPHCGAVYEVRPGKECGRHTYRTAVCAHCGDVMAEWDRYRRIKRPAKLERARQTG
jgi:predicted RNA-binding Zn-ribbon protein involved in translation (DUF1610 family)